MSMIFNQITTNERVMQVNEADGIKKGIFIRPLTSNTGELPKYNIDLRNNNSLIGFVAFYVDSENAKSNFLGMKINPEFRQNGYGSLLVSAYIDMCNESGINDFDTNPKQRKPEIIHLLKKFGYGLDRTPPSSMEIVMLQSKASEVIESKFYIPDIALRKKMEFSCLSRRNGYEFVDSLDGETILDKIYFGQRYRLIDRDECLRKQCQVQKRFDYYRTSRPS